MKPRTLYFIIAALTLFLPLAGLVYLGTFTRFYADDFCMAGDAMHYGLPGMVAKWYSIWTGRFSFLLGTGLFGLGGPQFAGWLILIVLIAWLAGLGWTISPLISRAGWPRPRIQAGLAGGLIILIVLSTTPNLFQSFFWQDGMVNYTLPLIGLTINIGVILRTWLGKLSSLAAGGAAFGLAFISGGFTEVVSAMQVALIILVLVITFFLVDKAGRGRLVMVLIAALAGALAAITIVLVAPGNQVRQATNVATPGLVRIITFSIRNAAVIVGKYILWAPGWAFLSAVIPFLAGWVFNHNPPPMDHARINLRFLWAKNWFRGVVLLLLAAFGLIIASCAPVVFALNAYPDDRTIIVPQYVLVIGVIFASGFLGYGLSSLGLLPGLIEKPILGRWLLAAILASLLLACGSSLWKTTSQAPNFQVYTQAWDKRSSELQQASRTGITDVTVRGLNSWFGVADLSVGHDFWINACMAEYYGLHSVTGN